MRTENLIIVAVAAFSALVQTPGPSQPGAMYVVHSATCRTYTNHEWVQGNIGVGTSAIVCQVPATAGSITIPASMIAQLPVALKTATGSPMVELLLREA